MKKILGYISTSSLQSLRAGDKCSAAVMQTPEGDWKHPILDGSVLKGGDAMQEAFNAAINFAIDEPEAGTTFLRYWREGAWDVLKREWPEFKGPFPA